MIKQKNASAVVIALVVLSVAAVVAAGLFLFPYSPDKPPIADDINSTQEGIQQVVNSNNQFAFDLYKELNKEGSEKNQFYSPYSISAALAMTYEGAKGKTADEMKSVFYFPDKNILRPNFAAIYNNINRADKAYQLRTGNALWLQKDYPFFQEYTSLVEQYYGGKAANVDFISETEKSRQTINSFIEEQTNDKIKELIPQGSLNPITRMVLTNAIYFKGTWEWQFKKGSTSEQNFKISLDKTVKVPMMYMDNKKAEFNYADLENLQMLELPYEGNDISMLVILPTEDLTSIEPEFTLENLKDWKSKMHETGLSAIYLPKFEFDTKYSMKETLSDLGMPTAFSNQADFSGMTNEEQLYIDSVIHQAFVKVDEEGTEAAAATAVVMGATSAAPRNIFRADHPFIFIIQEKATGNILFMGKVVDPTQ